MLEVAKPDTVSMCLVQIRPSDGFRDELYAYRRLLETEHDSIVFDWSHGVLPLTLLFLTAEPAAFALGRLPENRVDAA